MKFSIIICAKNEERNIAEMLDSIRSLKTSARDYEVIVVNDHSNDKTVKIAKNSGIKKLKILKTAGHGVAATRNTGILAAEGKIIVFADCDGVLELKNFPHSANIKKRGELGYSMYVCPKCDFHQ